MKIGVKYFESFEFITVQGGFWENGEFEMEWCNHHGADEEIVTHTGWNYSKEDIDEWHERIMACDKCEMFDRGDGWEWND